MMAIAQCLSGEKPGKKSGESQGESRGMAGEESGKSRPKAGCPSARPASLPVNSRGLGARHASGGRYSRASPCILAAMTESQDPQSTWATDFLAALGYLLVQSNYLEDALLDLYWILTRKDRSAAATDVRGKTLGQLYHFVVAAYEAKFVSGELREKLDRLKPQLEIAIGKRNEFVHASWSFDYSNELMHRTRRPRTGALGELKRLKVADVEAAIGIVGTAAEDIWEKLYDSVEPATLPL